jgi:hypothetical protein
MCFTGCLDEEDPLKLQQNKSFSSTETAKPDEIQDCEFRLTRDSIHRGNSCELSWITDELTTKVSSASRMSVKASHAFDKNAVLDEDRNAVIDVAFAQAHTSYSELKANKEVGYYSNTSSYSQRATAILGDGGTECYLDAESVIKAMNIREKYYSMAADSVMFNKAKIINLRFIEIAQTRAAEFYIDVDHPFFVEVTWGVPYVTVNLTNNYNSIVEVKDTITDYPLRKNDLVKVEYDTDREVLDKSWESGRVHLRFIHKNKEVDSATVNIPMKYGISTVPEYLKEVSSFDYIHTNDNPFETGASYVPADMSQEYVSFEERAIKFSGDATNGAEPINTPYVFKSQKATYKRVFGNITVEVVFPFVDPVINEKTTYVQAIASEDKKYDYARFFNKINVSYLGYYQEAQETVKLRKKAQGIEKEGFEDLGGTRTVFNDSINHDPWYRIEYKDGTIVRTTAHLSLPRLREMFTDWLSTEKNANQTTSNLVLSSPSYRKGSQEIDGFLFEYEFEERGASSVAALDASTQDNKGRVIEPVHVKVTYRNHSVTYTDLVVRTSNSASVSGGALSDGYNIYSYRDVWTYTLGNNTVQMVAPGTIRVKAADPDPEITFKGWVTKTITVYDDGRIVRDAEHLKQWSNGKEERKNFSLTTYWGVKATSSWAHEEENNTQSTSDAVLSVTSKNVVTKNVDGATFKVPTVKATAKSTAKLAGSSQNNGWTLEYEEGSSSVEYDGDVTEFDQLIFNISNAASVTGGNEVNGYYEYNYADMLSASLNGKVQYASAPGLIRVKVAEPEPTVTYHGFVSTQITVSNGTIKRDAEHLTKWSNGKEERKNFSLTSNWGVNADTNWTSEEKNNTQSTSNAVLNVTSRSNETKVVDGATFTLPRVYATANSTAKLNASSQNNGWTLVYEEGSSSIEYNGDVAYFDPLTFNISNSASVSGATKVNGFNQYKYADKLTASLNGKTQSASATGLIKVKAKEPTFFPEEWKSLKNVLQTVANNEGHNGYVYTLSFQFEGYVLPVVVRAGSISPEWHFEFVEKTEITSYNGGTYEAATGKWINTTAKDEPNHMIWSRSGIEVANKNYNEARNQQWDENHLVNGRPSVNTNRYSFTIANGRVTIKDTYTNKTMGSWSFYTED